MLLSLQLPLLVATTSVFLVSSALGSPSVFDVMRDQCVCQHEQEGTHTAKTTVRVCGVSTTPYSTATPPTHLSEPLLPGGQRAEAKSGASHSQGWWARYVLRAPKH